ncbi:MAG: toxin-antitoxin system YwqK family antitoxin [Saprospiraceae bacterium]|nr:toxin-antitoxin system YwqK family antitoxin [Saprospiraceae bacterium]
MKKIFLLLVLANACHHTRKSEERIERFETGVISRIIPMIDGKKEGIMRDFYPDGKLMAERAFQNNLQEGKTRIYYPSGNLKEVQYYTNGLQTDGDTLWYENGAIQFSVTFKANKKNGYLRKWDQQGQLIYESKYSMDSLVEVKGEPIEYYERRNNPDFIKPKQQ